MVAFANWQTDRQGILGAIQTMVFTNEEIKQRIVHRAQSKLRILGMSLAVQSN